MLDILPKLSFDGNLKPSHVIRHVRQVVIREEKRMYKRFLLPRIFMLSELKRALYLGLMASILALLLGVSLGRAEPPRGEKANWNYLKNLVSGQEVQVVLTDTKSFQGKFQSVSDEALVVYLASGDKSFGRQTVLRVSSKGQSHRLWNTALGAAVGFGGGAAIGAAAGNPSAIGGRGITALVGAAIGVATGAVTGAALPSGGWHDVYRAR